MKIKNIKIAVALNLFLFFFSLSTAQATKYLMEIPEYGTRIFLKKTPMNKNFHHQTKSFFSTHTSRKIVPEFMVNGYAMIKRVVESEEASHIYSHTKSHFLEQARNLNISLDDYFKHVNRWRHPSPLVSDVENSLKTKLLPYAQELYGEDVFLQKSDIVIKTKKCRSLIPLHQDISYHPNDPYQLTSWLSLSAANKNSGGIYLIPGSHIYGINKAVDLVTVEGDNHDLLITQLLKKEPIDIETESGDVIFFDSKLWHGSRAYSGALSKDDIRISIISRWKHPSLKTVIVPNEDSTYNRKNAKELILNIIKKEIGELNSNINDIDIIDIYIDKIKHSSYNNKLINLLEGLKINIRANEKFFCDDLQGNLFKALKFHFHDKIFQNGIAPHQKIPQSLDVERKKDHIEINLKEDVQSGLKSGFETIQFVHNALPEFSYDDIDITTEFLGKRLQAPVLISSMTGGTNRARDINYRLAEAAQKAGIAMGLGSMRVLLKEPDMIKTFSVRHVAPDIFLLANLGAVQLNYGVTPKECQQLVDAVGADALILHLNILQELTQPEGDKNWENLLPKIKAVVNQISVPVVVKEVGYGLSEKVSKDLIDAGVKALDIAGSGGTSWSQVEAYRSTNQLQNRIAKSFINWGIPTLDSLRMVKNLKSDIPVIASGGLKSGIDGAKALHAGANLFGLARPFLKAADTSEKDVSDEIKLIIEQLKISMLCTGSQNVRDLRKAAILKKD